MASIKCGHCKSTHMSVDTVRSCAKLSTTDYIKGNTPTTDIYTVQVPVPTSAPVIAASPLLAIEPGMYQNASGEIFKVQYNKLKTGLYAKKLYVTTTGGVKGYFSYAPGVVPTLHAGMRMTLESAQKFADVITAKHGVGICCVCGRVLTNEVSVSEKIGPVCKTKL